jgi:hypothetical protein
MCFLERRVCCCAEGSVGVREVRLRSETLQEVGLLNDGLPITSVGGWLVGRCVWAQCARSQLQRHCGEADWSGYDHRTFDGDAQRDEWRACGAGCDWSDDGGRRLCVWARACDAAAPPGTAGANCLMTPALGNAVPPQMPSGPVTFTQYGPHVMVSYNVSSVGTQPSGFHVHQWGNIMDPKGMGACVAHARVFSDGSALHWRLSVGAVPSCVAAAARDRYAVQLWAAERDHGDDCSGTDCGHCDCVSVGGYVDGGRMSGNQSIVGRSLVIHNGTAGARLGQCVIGIINATALTPVDCVATVIPTSGCSCANNSTVGLYCLATWQGTQTVSVVITRFPMYGGQPCPGAGGS